MNQFFTLTSDQNGVAFLSFDRSDNEMNILSRAVLEELDQLLETIAQKSELNGLVFSSGKSNQFIVGADIKDIASFETKEDALAGASAMQAIFQKIHNLPIPTVAAINGTCLGGGLELSLACTWRVVADHPKTKLGLPEIQLGLIPGAGGTQRLPRLIGIQTALDMILTGKQIPAKKALKMGLADACVPPVLLKEQAAAFALKSKSERKSLSSHKTFGIDLPKLAIEGNLIGRKLMHKKAKDTVDEKTKGFYPASYKALEAVFEGFDMTLENGLKLEARLFSDLIVTKEARSLIHLFHATTIAKKNPYRDDVKERFGSQKIGKIGVVGAGFMGAGIATIAADKGIKVVLSDPSKDSVGRAFQYAHQVFKKSLDRKRIKPFEMKSKLAHISGGLSTQGFSQCDLAIEAVFEDINLKTKILQQLESEPRGENWFFASNTSALPIMKIAEASQDPSRICGMHFFSPVEKMPLLEVVITDKTAPWVAGRAAQIGQDLGKQVIIVKDGPGFYTTRALAFYLAEAAMILTEGCSVEDIDHALTSFGFPVGPLTLVDEVGIDVGIHVLETIEKSFPDRITSPKGLKGIVDSGRLGRKNGKGFYLYEDGKRKTVDDEIYALMQKDVKTNSKPLRVQDIVDRCLLTFVAESARCLEEGILRSAYDGDIGAVFGLGFPPFWGGPFKYIDHLGAKTICERLKELRDRYGDRFIAPNILQEYAEKNLKFFPEE